MRKIIPTTLSSVLAALALVGCNASEDFDDASLSATPITGPSIQDPLDPSASAVEIEFVAGLDDAGSARSAVVSGLGYSCGAVVSYIPAEGNTDGYVPNLARCAVDATSVEFFIGQRASGRNRVSLGTFHLPVCSGRRTTGNGDSCFPGPGFFQVTVADLLNAPAREAATEPEVRNRAALLFALDADTATTDVLEIDSRVHELINERYDLVPASRFAAEDYLDFRNDWTPMLNEVAAVAGNGVLPADQARAGQMALAAMDRTRAGVYQIVHDATVYLPRTFAASVYMEVPLLVFPDGEVIGGGLLSSLSSGTGQSDLLALESGTRLSDTLVLEDDLGPAWGAGAVLYPEDSQIRLEGRILNTNVYDLFRPDEGYATDYEVDYPGSGVYAVTEVDSGDFTGTLVKAEFSEPTPYRMTRTGTVAGGLEDSVTALLPRFYRLTFYKACTDGTSDPEACAPIDPDEIGLNYPEYIDIDGSDSDPGYPVTEEQPRALYYQAYAGSLNLEILPDGSVITDRDGDCAATDASTYVEVEGATQEYRVGFVSRTEASTPSANLVLHLIGPPGLHDESVPEHLPHYGTQVQGRIDLSQTSMPLYRLGDANFASGIRAAWADYFQPIRYHNSLGATPTEPEQRELSVLSSGAVRGVGLDSDTCAPAP